MPCQSRRHVMARALTSSLFLAPRPVSFLHKSLSFFVNKTLSSLPTKTRATMAANSDLTLIGAWPSPFVLRARIALNIKNLDYHFHEESFGTKSELLLKSNPVYKKIPVLVHKGRSVCESLIIVEYVSDVWTDVGHSIVPSDPFDRATARFWSFYIDDKLFPGIRGIASAADEEAKKAAVESLVASFALLEQAFADISKGKPFFGGDHIGLLDIQFGSLLGWIAVTELTGGIKLIDPATTPGLAQWSDTFRADPAVASVMPETPKLAEFAKFLFAKMKAGAQPPK